MHGQTWKCETGRMDELEGRGGEGDNAAGRDLLGPRMMDTGGNVQRLSAASFALNTSGLRRASGVFVSELLMLCQGGWWAGIGHMP